MVEVEVKTSTVLVYAKVFLPHFHRAKEPNIVSSEKGTKKKGKTKGTGILPWASPKIT